jgi:hypothetical protein
MIGIPLGLLYGNAAEWILHRYLHRAGRDKKNFYSFHWFEHHKNSRQSGENFDEVYTKHPVRWDHAGKEMASLVALAVGHIPLFPFAPFFTATLWYCVYNYYRVHKRSHLDIEWARKHVPWHVDHHMGPDQNANWCVTKPWTDILLGTRQHYVGTPKEREDMDRAAQRLAKTIVAKMESLPVPAATKRMEKKSRIKNVKEAHPRG